MISPWRAIPICFRFRSPNLRFNFRHVPSVVRNLTLHCSKVACSVLEDGGHHFVAFMEGGLLAAARRRY